jgi:hypothetical protein
VSDISAEEILAELQALQDDPEKLKAKAAELAVQVASEAEQVSGVSAHVLSELASDLEAVAEDGNLSVLEEKVARGTAGAVKPGVKSLSPGGMSGGTGASIKWIEALVAEGENEEEVSLTQTLEEYLEELAESETAAETAESAENTPTAPKIEFSGNRTLNFYGGLEQYFSFSLTA